MLQVITHIYIVKNKECASHVFVVCLAKNAEQKPICSAFFSILHSFSIFLSILSYPYLAFRYRGSLHNQ